MQKQQAKGPMTPTEDMLSLLGYQDQLLNVVHTELYARPSMEEDDIVRFQVHFLTDINDAWRRMTEHLLFCLVRQRMPYDNTLRDYFHKLINVDYMPFIRINKHEITQISLFGFDIYIEPLSAILEILNRIDGQRHILLRKKVQNEQQVGWSYKQRDIWWGIRQGWDQFMYQNSLYKLSLNVYMLRQYLKVGAKSLVKKDKEIVFTGCWNIFTEIVPILKRNREIWLLCQLGELNNELYQFHPSFNYSHYFSLLLPLHNQYQSVFKTMRSVGQKCLNANLLTPLLLALLRNREAFHIFITNVDDYCWVPYLNGLVFGLVYNFKARILEYEQALAILQAAIRKLGVLGQLEAREFVGQLGKQWGEARDFFISALKVGYNVGELQTWHPVDSRTIQSRIIECTRNSLLMHSQLPQQTPIDVYFPNGFDDELEQCLNELTGSLVNKNQLLNSYSPNTMEAITINETRLQCVLKLNNLLHLCKLQDNTNCVCYILGFLNKIYAVNSSVVVNRLTKIGDHFCQIAIKQLEMDPKGKQDLKEVLFAYIKKNRPTDKIDEIIRVCLMISVPKQAISQVLSIISQNEPAARPLVAAHIISAYCPQKLGPVTKVKTFDKQYNIERDIININSQLYLTFSVLIDNVIQNNSGQAVDVLVWMVRLANWTVVPLLSFPVSWRYDAKHNKKLESFSTYLIANPQHHLILYELLEVGLTIDSKQIQTYFKQICMNTVCDQVILEVNNSLDQLCRLEDNMQYRYILDLLLLFVKIYQASNTESTVNIIKKIMKLYLRAVEKLDNVLVNSEDEKIVMQIANSLLQVYCPLLDLIYGKADSVRKWRTCMRKVCLNSLDITIQHLHNARDFELPLIRKDKGFLIHNPVDNIESSPLLSIENIKQKTVALIKLGQKYSRKNILTQNKQKYLNPSYLISADEVKKLRFEQIDVSQYSKENLLPPLSSKLIKLLYSHAGTMDTLFTELFCMTPSNHHRLIEYALLTKNPNLITQMGLSRQSVEKLLPQIVALLSPDELQKLTAGLDANSKKNISDNFNFMLMKQQQNCNDFTRISQLIIDLSSNLGFLLVFNQSNWRYANQVINELATTKMSGLGNTPSLLLQYTEYIKITYQPNADYQSKISQYLKLVQAYESLLTQKLEYLASLDSPASKQLTLSGKTLKQSFLREDAISPEEIKLFKVNELAYIQSFIDAWNVRDFLSRAAELIKQLPNFSKDLTQFTQITQLIDNIVKCFMNVNKIVNELARGNIMCPDFLYSYALCSDSAYHNAKINLGQHLEAYYRKIQKDYPQQYCFLPMMKACPILPYLQKYLPKTSEPLPIPQTMNPHVVNKTDPTTKKHILDKYTELQKLLSANNIISIRENKIQFQSGGQKQINPLQLFYFGVLYRALELTDQNRCKLGSMTDTLRRRETLSWQSLKSIDPQAYHHIKAVLVDDEIEKRKYLFVYKESALVPQGSSIEVNKLNREKYCNLVGKTSVGQNLFSNIQSFLQGVSQVTSV